MKSLGTGESIGRRRTRGFGAIHLVPLALASLSIACGQDDEMPPVAVDEEGGALAPDGSDEPLTAQEEAMLVDSQYVQIPGYRIHRSCIHEAEDGTTVEEGIDRSTIIKRDGRVVASHPRCGYPSLDMRRVRRRGVGAAPRALQPPGELQPPEVGDWVAYSRTGAPWNNGRGWFSRITGRWNVPANPTMNGGLIYFFNDLVTTTPQPNEILQPVLQWGYNGYIGGNRWVMAGWWVPSGGTGAVHSTPKDVFTGQLIEGHVYRTSGTCTVAGVCDWKVQMTSIGNPSSQFTLLNFTATNRAFLRADQAVLEAYHVTNCNQFPSSPSVIFDLGLLYQPAATGDHNVMVEMYPNVSWTRTVTPGLSPACGYAVGLFPRGATLFF
jgi:hypothetical protein